MAKVAQIFDKFLDDALPFYVPRLKMLKKICTEFLQQNPKFCRVGVSCDYDVVEDILGDFELEQIFYLTFYSRNGHDLDIKVYSDIILVARNGCRAVWDDSGFLIKSMTDDPLVAGHADLKRYLFAVFSDMV